MAVKPIPEGYRTVTPHVVVNDGRAAIEFYKKAFGAEEITAMPGPDGKSIMHAQLKIGDSMLMLGGEFPGSAERCGMASPVTAKVTTCAIHLYVENVDASFDRAVKAGATVVMPPMDAFWGDRYGQVKDPFGHLWTMGTHKQDLTPAQIMDNAKAAFGGCGKP